MRRSRTMRLVSGVGVSALLCGVAVSAPAQAAPRNAPGTLPGPGTVTGVLEFDTNNDGTPDLRITTIKTFDSRGHLVASRTETDQGADGSIESTTSQVSTFDGRGNVLMTVEEVDDDNDGFADYRRTTTRSYDAAGNLTRAVDESDPGADGLDVETTTYDFSSTGHPAVLESVMRGDFDGDGSEDDVQTYRDTLDRRGNPVASSYELDFDGDGTVEYTSESTRTFTNRGGLISDVTTTEGFGATSRQESINEYDRQGRLVGYSLTSTFEQGGRTELVCELAALTFDNRGNLIAAETVQDSSCDQEPEYLSTSTLEYGASGDLVKITSDLLDVENPELNVRVTEAYAYQNAQGLRTSLVYEVDLGIDGSTDQKTLIDYRYDRRGNEIYVDVRQYDAEENLEQQTVTTSEYDRRGVLTRITNESDNDGDGNFDETETYTATNSR